MDVGAFVQENKRWLIGCAIGALVFWIAYAVIRSIYDADAIATQIVQLRRANSGTEVHTKEALDAARAEQEQLALEKQKLQQELAFEPSAKFTLGAGPAEEQLFQAGRTVMQAVLTGGSDRDVQVFDKDVTWPVPQGIDEIRAVLFGLELLDESAKRLFAAHDATRARAPEAMGLRSILTAKVEGRTQRAAVRGTKPGEVVLADHLAQERVTLKFQADAGTAHAFFESCREPRRTLVLGAVSLQQGERPSDPVTVHCELSGIAWKGDK